ncbi:MAG TPA: hypothetical protein VEF06_07225 [Bryobacteraceae bacterium]|nr:hypothetical protein [Bryobacteraceae bacterium]
MTVRISESELVRDAHSILARVQEGVKIVVEQDHRPIAVITTPTTGRLLSEAIAFAEARGSSVTFDGGLVKDVEEGIAGHARSDLAEALKAGYKAMAQRDLAIAEDWSAAE